MTASITMDGPSGGAEPRRPALPALRPLIRVQMAKRGVRSVRALYRMLEPYEQAHDLRLSLAQLYRLIDGEAKQINVDGLTAICAVLDCDLHDLYEVTPAKGTP